MTISRTPTPVNASLLQREILTALSSAPGDSTLQCSKLKPLFNKNREETCQIILHNLVQLNFPPGDACTHWNAIVKHAHTLESSLKRKVGLTTAACDYFSTINPCLDNPKLIEFTYFEKMLRSAHHDFLTGLLTRGAFHTSFEQEISRAKRHSHNATLVFFDLDGFKEINDKHGHLAGDEVLRQVGAIILASKRKEDVACRFGGDEFVILLPETDRFMALRVSEKIHKKINSLIIYHDIQPVAIKCSGGLASFPIDSSTGTGLLDCADRALYQAKSRKAHQLTLFSRENRHFTRIAFEHSVQVRLVENDSSINFGKSKNISKGGLLISMQTPYTIGTTLELEIPLKETDPLVVTGKVVRLEQIKPDTYDVGLSFLKSKNTTNSIATFILQQLTS